MNGQKKFGRQAQWATCVICLINYFYQIIEPLLDSILAKDTDIICEKQAKLQRKPVKMSLLAVLIFFLYLIIFWFVIGATIKAIKRRHSFGRFVV